MSKQAKTLPKIQLGQTYHRNVLLFISYLIYDNAILLIADFTRHDLSRWKRIDIYFFSPSLNRTSVSKDKCTTESSANQLNATYFSLPLFFLIIRTTRRHA